MPTIYLYMYCKSSGKISDRQVDLRRFMKDVNFLSKNIYSTITVNKLNKTNDIN